MRRLVVLAVLALGACGDNVLAPGPELGPARELVVVAHQDDDLLFMQPDVLDAARADGGMTIVYVTAGNGSDGDDPSYDRIKGVIRAYQTAAGGTRWRCGWIDILGHAAQSCRADGGSVTLVFLAYPDGGKDGEHAHSLLKLWTGTIDGATTVAERTTHYSRSELVDVVAEVIRVSQPSVIRTLEIAGTHGRDHSDHEIVGALTLVATSRVAPAARLVSYRGYDTADEPVNKTDALYATPFDMMAHYEACALGCGTCGQACDVIDATHETWLHRRYAVGMGRHVRGRLRTGTLCLGADLTLIECVAAPSFELDGAQVKLDGKCASTDGGRLGIHDSGACSPLSLDDDSHLWLAEAPSGRERVTCVRADGSTSSDMTSCATWDVVPETTSTPRPVAGTVRLGDVSGDGLADLCGIAGGNLLCANGDGTGHFGAATVRASLVVDGNSLVITQGLACGYDGLGIQCSDGDRWTLSFSQAETIPETNRSLAFVDGKLCGITSAGVACAARGEQASVLSNWPRVGMRARVGDLDNDGTPDWCAFDGGGIAQCSRAIDRAVTAGDAVPWAYAWQGVFEDVTPQSTLGDVDGDGAADLCELRAGRVQCSRSQGHAFGPAATIADFGGAAGELLLGDLDGNATVEPCVDTGTDILCVKP